MISRYVVTCEDKQIAKTCGSFMVVAMSNTQFVGTVKSLVTKSHLFSQFTT